MTKIVVGHILDAAEQLKPGTFHCILTSPPYWMLRDYETPHQIWPDMIYRPMVGLDAIHVPEWKGELGQEPELNAYIGHLVMCFRALMPALRDDGTLFVNLGDSYITTGKTSGIASSTLQGRKQEHVMPKRLAKTCKGLDMKQRVGVPWRFAMAMQADGWIWRDEIVWYKPSAMPGSQRDRTTYAHETILMFSKTKNYFYDIHAISEPVTGNAHPRGKGTTPKSGANAAGCRNNDSFAAATNGMVETRNPRSVWTITSEPSKEKHFAAWPSKLATRIIKAGTSEHGCCSACGAPWQKTFERMRVPTRPGTTTKLKKVAGWQHGPGSHNVMQHNKDRRNKGLHEDSPYQQHTGAIVGNRDPLRHTTVCKVTGWEPTCECNASIVPCQVLDPFGGTGKTALAAERLHRQCTLIELSEFYAKNTKAALKRMRIQEAGMFA